MKVLLGATAAVLLLASPVFAQTATLPSCQNFPPPPPVPDGATASLEQMASAQATATAWRTDMETRLNACRADIEAQVAIHNQQDAVRVSITNALAAETVEFNARLTSAPSEGQQPPAQSGVTRE